MDNLLLQLGELFLNLLNTSITASYLIFAAILIRLIFKKCPKWANCLLWALVAVELLLPVDIESVFSIMPQKEPIPVSGVYGDLPTGTVSSQVNTVTQSVDDAIQTDIIGAVRPSSLQNVISIIACLWITGIAAMLIYSLISYLKVKKSVNEAMYVKENIYLCDNISTPFILGLFKPKIYLPSTLYRDDVLYVVDHEKAHIKRLDHIWKPLGYLLLTIYWFNPTMWVAYILLCKDIELACDEKVIRNLSSDCKKEYSNALINCSSERRMISACPLAFGETGVKNRIKSVLSYKKPAFRIIAVSLIICAALSVTFLTVPPKENNKGNNTAVNESVYSDKFIEGEYVYYGTYGLVKPTVVLKRDGTFSFNLAAGSEYFYTGNYSLSDTLLTLNADDGVSIYTFDVTEDGFVFDAFNSSEIPEIKVSEDSYKRYNPVSNNAMFVCKQPVGANSYLDATVLEVKENSILVEPVKDEPLNQSAGMISVSIDVSSSVQLPYLRVADEVRIVYDGLIQETFPLQINGTIAIYLLESDNSEKEPYSLEDDDVEYIEYLSRTDATENGGKVSEFAESVRDAEKVKLFIKRFNEIIKNSGIDEDSTPDTGFSDITFINVYYKNGRMIKITLPGNDRVRLGINERRMISSYERELLISAISDSEQEKINRIVSGNEGKVNITDKEFWGKAEKVTNDMSLTEITKLFGESPYIGSRNGNEAYYYFNGEYILIAEKGMYVYIRKISDPDFRHTIS